MNALALEDLSPKRAAGAGSPQDFAARVVTRSKSSFTFGMRMLGRPRREAMFAIYAFARTIDDIADGDWPAPEKLRLLGEWRDEIDGLYRGAPRSTICDALLAPVRTFELPRQEFLMMIEGMEMDAAGPVRVPDMATLLAYTRRVAGTVGMLSVRIFGAEPGSARDRFALDLADAFQLTNILRDVEEDAAIGRLYLPRELLDRHGLPTGDPVAVAAHGGIEKVCGEIGQLARERFASARLALRTLDGRTLRPALMMMGVYEAYLDRLEAAAWRRTVIPLKMSKTEKLLRGVNYAFFGAGGG